MHCARFAQPSSCASELVSLNAELERDYGVSLAAPHRRQHRRGGDGHGGAARRPATRSTSRPDSSRRPNRADILIGASTHAARTERDRGRPGRGTGRQGERGAAVRRTVCSRVVEGAPTFERRFDAPLVGRRDELARVRAAFDEAVSERRCRLVTVLGPPGIGKSRLAREMAATLAGDAARADAGGACRTARASRTGPCREIFAAAGAEDELEAALSAPTRRRTCSGAVRKALEQRARERPLALVVEDIHWAEPTLLDLAEHLGDWTRDAPLLLLCLARPELLDERPAWGGEVMTLEPLSGARSRGADREPARRRPPRRCNARADSGGRGREPAVRRTVARDAGRGRRPG